MSAKKYLVAMDIGTHNSKAAVYDGESHCLYSATVGYSLIFPEPGYVEQDPEIWFQAAVSALKAALKKAPVEAAQNIAAICISGTNGLVFVDQQGIPVYNGVMYADRRSESQATALKKKHGDLFDQITGNRPAPGSFSLPIINWFREERPEIWKQVETLLAPAGYIVLRLTGKRTIDSSRAAMTLFFNQAEHCWAKEIINAENIPEQILPQLAEPWEIVGELKEETAKIIGINPRTPVLAGCVDSVASCLGMGAINSGRVLLMLGTTGRVTMVVNTPHFDSRFTNQCHAIPGHWICNGAMNNSGGSLKWFADTFGHLEKALSARTGLSVYQLIDEAAAQSPPGAKGLIYLPYLSGERTPMWNSKARGVFFGLFEGSAWPDIARSVMEGVAYSFMDNLRCIEEVNGEKATELTLVGGGAGSVLWRQIISDVLEKPLRVSENADSETLGCLVLAGKSAGLWNSVEEGIAGFTRKEIEVRPEIKNTPVYQQQFKIFKSIYQALLPVFDQAFDNSKKR